MTGPGFIPEHKLAITAEWWQEEFGRPVVDFDDDLFCLWLRSSDGVVVLDAESPGRNAPIYSRETACKTRGDVRRLLILLGHKV